jgi:hypothetical protein
LRRVKLRLGILHCLRVIFLWEHRFSLRSCRGLRLPSRTFLPSNIYEVSAPMFCASLLGRIQPLFSSSILWICGIIGLTLNIWR